MANSELTDPINESIRTVCAHYGIPVIWLKEIDKRANHPTRAGMTAIADQVLQFLNK